MKHLLTILLLTLSATIGASTIVTTGDDNFSTIWGVKADTVAQRAIADSIAPATMPMGMTLDEAEADTLADSYGRTAEPADTGNGAAIVAPITVGTAAATIATTTSDATVNSGTSIATTTSDATVSASTAVTTEYTFPRGAWDLSLQPRPHQVAIFCGADLSYADRNFLRLYDVLLNLTPGAKWHIGNDLMVAGQIHVPVANYGYGERMNMIRLYMADISKQIHFNNTRQHFKFSAGLFSRERMGVDMKWMWPVNRWLLFMAQAGVTGHWALGVDFKGNHEETFGKDWKFTGIAGAKFYLEKWETEFVLSGGRYLNKKMGAQLEIMRHFTYCTVSIYGQMHQKDPDNTYSNHTDAGGFKVVMMLPPYKRSKRKVAFRPASNFRLTYNAQSDGISMKMYDTDPEDNERQYPIDINWGVMRNR